MSSDIGEKLAALDLDSPQGEKRSGGSLDAAFQAQLLPLLERLHRIERQMEQVSAPSAEPEKKSTSSGHNPTDEPLLREIIERIESLQLHAPGEAASASANASDSNLSELLLDQQKSIQRRLDEFAAALPANLGKSVQGVLQGSVQLIQQQVNQMAAALQRDSAGRFDQLHAALEPLLHPPEPEEPQAGPAAAAWRRAVLAELDDDVTNAHLTDRLIEGVLTGDDACRSLAGQLLLFQSAPAEQIPQALKELGEAYYNWRPKSAGQSDTMEEAVLAWARRRLDNAGIRNAVEIVFPGDRFDAGRHNALNRGVEVETVRGWVVLRDNGKVYTKATVSLR